MLKRFLPAAVLIAASPAFAQGPGTMGRVPEPFGGPLRAPVTNAPYSATFTNTASEKLQDGTVLTHTDIRTVCRDSLGRTREEFTSPESGEAGTGKSRTTVVILDPVARTMTRLRTGEKVAVVHALPQPDPSRAGRHGEAPAPSTPGAPPNQAEGGRKGPDRNRNVVKADLGARTIGGVVANGTRVTRTIPAGEMGNAAAIVSTREEWFSPDLKIEVSHTAVDPFRGTHTAQVSSLTRNEPDASLFKVPGDYTVKQAPAREAGRHGFGGPRPERGLAGPPPPPDAAPGA